MLDIDAAKKSKNPSITFAKLVSLLPDLALPLTNVSLLLMIATYIFSIIGMQMFSGYSYNPITSNRATGTLLGFELLPLHSNVTFINQVDLSGFWWGKGLTYLNFGNFSSAFVTLFNILCLNSWYDIMVNTTMISGSFNTPWFFFIWIFISNYFFISTLIAAVATVLEQNAKKTLNETAKSNKLIVENLSKLRIRLVQRIYVLQLKKNTIDSGNVVMFVFVLYCIFVVFI